MLKSVVVLSVICFAQFSFASEYLLVKLDFTQVAVGEKDVNGDERIGAMCGVDGAAKTLKECKSQLQLAEDFLVSEYGNTDEAWKIDAVQYGCFEDAVDYSAASGRELEKAKAQTVVEMCKQLNPEASFSTYYGPQTEDGVSSISVIQPEK